MENERIIEQFYNHRKWNLFGFTFITFLSIYYGHSTIFYVIYFFWCNELINIIVDRFFANQLFLGVIFL